VAQVTPFLIIAKSVITKNINKYRYFIATY